MIPFLSSKLQRSELIKFYKSDDNEVYDMNFLLSVIPILQHALRLIENINLRYFQGENGLADDGSPSKINKSGPQQPKTPFHTQSSNVKKEVIVGKDLTDAQYLKQVIQPLQVLSTMIKQMIEFCYFQDDSQ